MFLVSRPSVFCSILKVNAFGLMLTIPPGWSDACVGKNWLWKLGFLGTPWAHGIWSETLRLVFYELQGHPQGSQPEVFHKWFSPRAPSCFYSLFITTQLAWSFYLLLSLNTWYILPVFIFGNSVIIWFFTLLSPLVFGYCIYTVLWRIA